MVGILCEKQVFQNEHLPPHLHPYSTCRLAVDSCQSSTHSDSKTGGTVYHVYAVIVLTGSGIRLSFVVQCNFVYVSGIHESIDKQSQGARILTDVKRFAQEAV